MAGCAGQEANSAEAPAADPDPLEGAWRTVEVTTTGPDGSTNANPQPGLRLIVDGHYSLIAVGGTEPRLVLPEGAPLAERASNLQRMTAQAGSYEVAGDMVTARPSVAKNPAVMDAGSFTTLTYQLAGDMLTVTPVANEDGPIENPQTTKYRRIGTAARTPLDGAWRTLSITTTGPEGRTNDTPEPGLRLYGHGHYSVVQINRPRPAQFSANPTDEERIDIWSATTANGGTFEVVGDTVRTRAFVAMNPAVMAPDRAPALRSYRLQGDTLWLTQLEVENPITEKLVRAR
jgi:hypothetical protein